MGDFKNFKNHSTNQSYLAVLINPCFYSVKLYRISNYLYKKKVMGIAKIIWLMNRIIFNVDIDYRAQIGKRFMLVHGLNVVIGCNVVIGNDCKVYQGVTIGGNNKSIIINDKEFNQPIIGDRVIIYANSMVVGPINISDDKIIGAMKFINKNI